jgi:hypothetical protein
LNGAEWALVVKLKKRLQLKSTRSFRHSFSPKFLSARAPANLFTEPQVLSRFHTLNKGTIVFSKQQSWNLRNQNLPNLTFPNHSAPFRAFSNRGKNPIHKPILKTNPNHKPLSDRGIEEKSQQSTTRRKQQKRTNRTFQQQTAAKKTQFTRNQKTALLHHKV